MRSNRIMFAARAVFLLLIVWAAIIGSWSVAIFHAVAFLGSLFVPWLGRKDSHYYLLDAAICGVFSLSVLMSMLNLWPDSAGILFGYDKLFHIAGGACVALFWAILSRKHVKDRTVFYLGIVAFALAVGAAWEVFEWVLSILPPPFYHAATSYGDNMLDMVADTVGGVLMALALSWKRYV